MPSVVLSHGRYGVTLSMATTAAGSEGSTVRKQADIKAAAKNILFNLFPITGCLLESRVKMLERE